LDDEVLSVFVPLVPAVLFGVLTGLAVHRRPIRQAEGATRRRHERFAARFFGGQLVAVVGDSDHDDVRGGELVPELVELIEQPGKGQAGVLGEVRDLDASSASVSPGKDRSS
jgi:hypothetical protein